MASLAAAVLAGGRSRRFGTDKVIEPVRGIAMARRVAGALRAAGASPVVAVGGDPTAIAALGLLRVGEPAPGSGPLSGVAGALAALSTADRVAVMAADLPMLDRATVVALVAALDAAPDADAAWAHSGRVEPLVGVWRPRALEAVSAALAAGELALHEARRRLSVVEVAVDADAVRNVNRRDDLATLPAVTVPEIDVDALARHLEAGGNVLDVRQPAEFAEARVPGATLVVLDTVADHLDTIRELAGGTPLPIICRSGGRSLAAAEWLSQQGIEVLNVAGGTLAWIDSGRPVDSGDQAG